MASEAQVLANRRNAEKSTGPRTEEGKAVASQNAIRHGLLARQDVICAEEQEVFELHREGMLGELGAVGVVETMLAERIVSLSWRLKRAERIQNEAFDYMIAKGNFDPFGWSTKKKGDPDDDPGLTLGKVVAGDFGHARTLDRLLMYERRIENSLYRTMAELRKLKLARQAEAVDERAGRSHVAQPPSAGITAESGGATRNQRLCKTNPIAGNCDEREVGCGEGGMELVARANDGKTEANPAGRIDSLPAAHAATIMGQRNGMLE